MPQLMLFYSLLLGLFWRRTRARPVRDSEAARSGSHSFLDYLRALPCSTRRLLELVGVQAQLQHLELWHQGKGTLCTIGAV